MLMQWETLLLTSLIIFKFPNFAFFALAFVIYYKSSIVNFKILLKNAKHKNQCKYFMNKNVLSFVLNVATLCVFDISRPMP